MVRACSEHLNPGDNMASISCLLFISLHFSLLAGDFVGQLMDFLGPVVPFSVALGVVPIVGGLSVALLRMATLYLAGEKNFGPGLGGLIEEAESGLPFK
jgi:hypothetical protein